MSSFVPHKRKPASAKKYEGVPKRTLGGSLMQYLKAITGAVVTGLGTLQVAYSDNVVSQQEWIGVAIATVVALGAIWAVPNKQGKTKGA